MATFQATVSNWTNATSVDNYRAWGQYVSDQLTAVGLTKTADTGQVNWATASDPGGTNTYNDYEIRAFADALQATAPIVFKVRYGESAIADQPAVGIQFGTGSDGSGGLTGTLSTEMKFPSSSVTTSVTVTGSGSTNRFCLNVGAGNNQSFLFSFERTKDAQGNDTVEGATLFGICGNTGNASASTQNIGEIVWNPSIGNITAINTSNVACLFPSGSSFTNGVQIGVAPILPEKPLFMNPILGLVGFYTQDITTPGTFVAYMYGTAHQYYATNRGASSAFRGTGSGTEALAIRYE